MFFGLNVKELKQRGPIGVIWYLTALTSDHIEPYLVLLFFLNELTVQGANWEDFALVTDDQHLLGFLGQRSRSG